MTLVAVGAPAPDFTLKDQNNELVRLSGFGGRKNVVLVFYPLAFTRTCQGELSAIRDLLPAFQNDDVQLLTVSVDSAYAHKVWAEQEGFAFPLLSDFWPHGGVARAYGCFDETSGRATRGTFIIDTAGVVRWTVVHAPADARDPAEYLDVLSTL
ncbi:MAG: mycoredoxin-dependent peroxiredoxin [Frankiaceae bacterium]|nr:mycoredoxin-dependent peroxiredoxin [Frankiaceae bacterium]